MTDAMVVRHLRYSLARGSEVAQHPKEQWWLSMSSQADAKAFNATVVVGNPKPASRTRDVGVAVARACAHHFAIADPAIDVVELSELSSSLFGWGVPAVAAAKQQVLGADLVIVASPVYKASYTGLLKAFLDQFGRDELRALATVPLMVGSGPAHSLAVESQLRPVLVEIGASCPTRGLYILESEIGEVESPIAEWMSVWGNALRAVVSCRFGA
jgi:FMN reductase